MLDIIMYYISYDQETSQINIQIPIFISNRLKISWEIMR